MNSSSRAVGARTSHISQVFWLADILRIWRGIWNAAYLLDCFSSLTLGQLTTDLTLILVGPFWGWKCASQSRMTYWFINGRLHLRHGVGPGCPSKNCRGDLRPPSIQIWQIPLRLFTYLCRRLCGRVLKLSLGGCHQCRRLWDTFLALGGSRHPMEVFKDFRGREPTTDALLRHNGLDKKPWFHASKILVIVHRVRYLTG